jgi:hypothetical protein
VCIFSQREDGWERECTACKTREKYKMWIPFHWGRSIIRHKLKKKLIPIFFKEEKINLSFVLKE